MGVENMFVFGLRADAVAKIKSLGYDPRLYVEENRQLKRVIDAISAGVFSNGDTERYRALVDSLLQRDVYLLMADFADYVATQAKVDTLFADRAAWAERALRNIAGMGPFSSDRTIAEYVDRVWSVKSLN
jgi:starch phosphorylase